MIEQWVINIAAKVKVQGLNLGNKKRKVFLIG